MRTKVTADLSVCVYMFVCVCIFVRYFKLPSFMNGCDMCITSSGSESNNAKTVGSDILLVAVACSPY